MDWLTAHKPEIDWPNYKVTLPLASNKRLLIPGLAACNTKPTLVMCSAKVACKEVTHGDSAWLLLITPDTTAACPHGVEGAQANSLSVHG